MLEPLTINLGRQTRELVFSMRAATILSRQMPNQDVRDAMLYGRNPGLVMLVAAAFMSSKPESGKAQNVDAIKVGVWIDEEPGKYLELERLCLKAVARRYAALGLIDITKELVEDGDATPAQLEAFEASLGKPEGADAA